MSMGFKADLGFWGLKFDGVWVAPWSKAYVQELARAQRSQAQRSQHGFGFRVQGLGCSKLKPLTKDAI